MPLSRQAQAIVDDFGREPGVTPEHVTNLQGVLAASPVLLDQFNDAVAKQRVLSLKPLTDPNAGGTFTPNENFHPAAAVQAFQWAWRQVA